MFLSMEKILRAAACLACAMVVGMITVFLTTGVGQDPLQFVHSSVEYGELLLRNPAALRVTLGLDNAFIVFYATTFLALGTRILRAGAARALVLASVGLLLALAVLDMVENFHFMVMLARAERGLFPGDGEIAAQVWESLLKFHVSYLGLFLLGLALPRRTREERALASLSLFVQLPVGILIYVTPAAVAFPLVLVRFAYFLAALLLVARISRAPARGPSDEAAVGVRAGAGSSSVAQAPA